jgi:tetratricopeptide (TPR) repeat protein
VEKDPNGAGFYKNRGDYYCTIKDYESAHANYNRALEINPKNFETLHSKGLVYQQ